MMVVPGGNDAVVFLASNVWGYAHEGLMLGTPAEVTLPIIRAVDRSVVGLCLEALVTKEWLPKLWSLVGGITGVVDESPFSDGEGSFLVGRSLRSFELWDMI